MGNASQSSVSVSLSDQEKRQESENLALLARTCLAMYQRSPAQHQKMLTLATQYLIEALKLSSHNLEAYLQLAYLAYFYRADDKALTYLKHVLKKNPDHAEAQAFLEQLTRDMASSPPSVVDEAPDSFELAFQFELPQSAAS